MDLLKFGKGNAKLAKHIGTFSIPVGHTCPYAKDCKASVPYEGRVRVVDHKDQKYRCFAVNAEAAYPATREARRHNHRLLLKANSYVEKKKIIRESLNAFTQKNKGITAIRIHVGGDFFNQEYFDAWMGVAKEFPHMNFYAYTKSIPFWVNYLKHNTSLPENVSLTASEGGHRDQLIYKHGLKAVRVVMHPEEAEALALEIDHDDTHAMYGTENFALLLHGTQPKGSEPQTAIKRMKDDGVEFAYTSKKKPELVK